MTTPTRDIFAVTKAEACQYLGISLPTLNRRIADGTVVAYKFGPRQIRIDLDATAARLPRKLVASAAAGDTP